jgi:hypothetical protein
MKGDNAKRKHFEEGGNNVNWTKYDKKDLD